MLSFTNAEYLLLLIVIPWGLFLQFFVRNRGGRIPFPFRRWEGEGFAPKIFSLPAVSLVMVLLFWAGFAAAVTGLSGPILSYREKVYLNRGIDIMFVLDESPSMAAQDTPPVSRFDAAREVISDFAHSRENDAVGLISFGREAALRIPATIDKATFSTQLESLRIMDLGDGTAIGMGITLAALQLKSSTAVGKVIILITDGENNSGEIQPETAADLARSLGMRIYTIGFGTEGEVPIDFVDPATGTRYSGTLKGSFNEQSLKQIASLSGGMFFHASSPGTLKAVMAAIDSLEVVERKSIIKVQSRPLHREFILLAGILFILYLIFSRVILREVL